MATVTPLRDNSDLNRAARAARLKQEGIHALPVRQIPARSGRWDDRIAA